MMTPLQFAKDYIYRWEDGKSSDPKRTHSVDPDDRGNYNPAGKLIGSNHGVTAATLAQFRGVSINLITFEKMRDLTLDEAAQIALKLYYVAPKLDRLAWNAVTASIMDFGYTAGPKNAVEEMQDMIGVNSDGSIGPATIAAYDRWCGNRSLDKAAIAWAAFRTTYYEGVIARIPTNAKYRNGWANRTKYFLPGNPENWWSRFNAAA